MSPSRVPFGRRERFTTTWSVEYFASCVHAVSCTGGALNRLKSGVGFALLFLYCAELKRFTIAMVHLHRGACAAAESDRKHRSRGLMWMCKVNRKDWGKWEKKKGVSKRVWEKRKLRWVPEVFKVCLHFNCHIILITDNFEHLGNNSKLTNIVYCWVRDLKNRRTGQNYKITITTMASAQPQNETRSHRSLTMLPDSHPSLVVLAHH